MGLGADAKDHCYLTTVVTINGAIDLYDLFMATSTLRANANPKNSDPAALDGITRREFLNYVWAASMMLAMAGSATAATLFAMPRWDLNRLRAYFIARGELPQANTPPKFYKPDDGLGIWLVNVDDKLYAHANICTHLACKCLVWDDNAKIFACPAHGAQYMANGNYRAGPAPRGLDRFNYGLFNQNKRLMTSTRQGEALNLAHYPDATGVQIYPENLVLGKLRN